jgi:hypothetical protein
MPNTGCIYHYCAGKYNGHLRAFPPVVLSMSLQTVNFILKKSNCAGLAQEIGFSASNSCSLPWLVNLTQVYTSKKECNKIGPDCGLVFLIGRS